MILTLVESLLDLVRLASRPTSDLETTALSRLEAMLVGRECSSSPPSAQVAFAILLYVLDLNVPPLKTMVLVLRRRRGWGWGV
jgi:hypothetical protein